MQAPRESYGHAAMDFEYVPASPGSSRWAGESAARRRQRRLSSPSLRTYLTPAFDAVAGGDGGVSGYTSSSSSGGLELGFDASLLRYRRSCFAASADLDSRVLLYSPQSAPPPPQMRAGYLVADDGVWAPGGGHYGSKHEAGRLTGAPGFQDSENRISFVSAPQTSSNLPTTVLGASTLAKLPAELQLPEGSIVATNAELPTPGPDATPSALKSSADPEPSVEGDEIIEALYGDSGRRRLPIFREICPE
ncbi:hypothetical protein BDA96_02G403600 [Sorghum bicolor]|uniref:Uncharacterized protein n=3 Tax=Sorghum bicolor TaxID=4558 RepID=A0A921RU24_SORBI|nr:uncharacterized protein LOC8079360 isoform X1 [Sorghum bicolor]KAG0545928.1 hypothetical protein BDA96_02G403600 [Sorghum bicolor]KXG36758.1 hypothetical protein SORBI_3002G384200 [Sorghum bicolor]|eukprot:XP_021307861.1 uncharacterized protein LOC8079360 isoform X1 [Sorghum bicolor]